MKLVGDAWRFSGTGILLDVEGTLSPISFVVDEMFPFVRRELAAFLDEFGTSPDVRRVLEQVIEEGRTAGIEVPAEASPADAWRGVTTVVGWLMDMDSKTGALKVLQGLVWRRGFERGELRAKLFPDVRPVLERWRSLGIDVRIYSSGSVLAQKLFFAHTTEGDLTPLLTGHFDTHIGAKKSAASYAAICRAFGLAPRDVLFVSDVVEELDAARVAGLATALAVRPGNPAPSNRGHPEITRLDDVPLLTFTTEA